jgi:hypothetical protein
MASAINLQELEQELVRTKAMFEQWSASMLSQAQHCKASHTSKLMTSKGDQPRTRTLWMQIISQHSVC